MTEPIDSTHPAMTIDGGYAVLILDSDTTYTAHTTANSIRSLAAAIAFIANGEQTAACRWSSESGGHFIDLVRTPAATTSLAIHEFRAPRNPVYAEHFTAQRGPVSALRHYDTRDFLQAIAIAYWKLRILETDQYGFMPNWGWPFPQREFDQLHLVLQQGYGFKLPPTQEIIDGRY